MSQINDQTFGELLKKYRLNCIDPDLGGSLTQERLVELISQHDGRYFYSPSILSRWQKGERLGSFKERGLQLTLLHVLHQNSNEQGLKTLAQANKLLELLNARDLTEHEAAAINPDWVQVVAEPPIEQPDVELGTAEPCTAHPVEEEQIHEAPGQNLGRWFREVGEYFFRFSEADEHTRSTWAGLVIHALSHTTKQLENGLISRLIIAATFWLATYFLLSPLWKWQLDDIPTRFFAMVYFAIGSLAIPIGIAWVTRQEVGRELETDTVKKWLTVFFLKYVGAITAFNVLAVGYFLLPIIPSSFFDIPSRIIASNVTWGVLSLPPVIFGYVGAQRIPVDRYKMYSAVPQLHEADKMFGSVFTFFGPGVAYGIYTSYEGMKEPIFGWILLLSFVILGVWQGQKNRDSFKRILITVLQVTLVLPMLVVGVFIIINLPTGLPAVDFDITLQSTVTYVLFFSYFVLLVATYVVTLQRNPPDLNFAGLVIFTLLAVGIWLLFRFNPVWGAIAFAAPFVIYPLIHRWLRPWFWLHPTFALAFALIFTSLALGLRGVIPVWLNLVGFWLIAAGLMCWAYRPSYPTETVLEEPIPDV